MLCLGGIRVLQLAQGGGGKLGTVLQVRAGCAELSSEPGIRPRGSLGPGSGDPFIATLTGSLCWPSWAVRAGGGVGRPSPSFREMHWLSPPDNFLVYIVE